MSDLDISTAPSQANGASPAVPTDNAPILEELLQSIDMGQGEFSLLLVRCNYRGLRQQLLAELSETSDLALMELTLTPTETSLYSAIAHHLEATQLDDTQPAAVSVFGLDAVANVEDLLAAANTMRESFRQQFPLALLLWVDDLLLDQIRHRMPDFKSWGATTFRFDWHTEALLAQLRTTCDRSVEGALQRATFTPLTAILTSQEIREAELAMAELTRRQVTLPADILGGLELNQGSSQLGGTPRPGPEVCATALAHYEISLQQWQTMQYWMGIGLAQFYCSLCHAHQENWAAAKAERQACLEAFAQAERSDLVARFVGSLGAALVELDDWDELAQRLPEWQALHAEQPVELAQDWSLQAEVAKYQQDWPQMQAHAERAIAIWMQHASAATVPLAYCLQQAEALAQQGQGDIAMAQLETARQTHQPQDDPAAFVRLLNQLRQLHFEAQQYRKAFEIKQERRGIQYQFQMRAFIGAGQLQPPKVADPTSETHFSFVASGRQSDIDALVNVRVSEPRHKLTVLCGLSGVGKSSLVRAGLVPALKGRQLRDRRALTVVMRVYSNWAASLGDALNAALAAYPEARLATVPTTVDQLKAQLRRNAEHRLLTVLIFDQFEEFFFICNQPAQRRQFYAFLRECLKGIDIQFVKVIFSLREDYLHELLEFEDYVKDLGVDFLGREQRQRIENFTPAVARSVITELSQRTTLQLDEDLVEALVVSLTNELGRIRPVELQVVGAQLEAEGITTLAAYRRLGENPKLVLAERWVGAVVNDCGPENADAAWQVLVALTRENGTRPLRTQRDLEARLEDYQKLLGTEKVSLVRDILPVLVGSGLAVRWPQESEDRYQLVHDYLVEPIRRRYNADYRQQLEQLVKDKQIAEDKQRREEARRKKLERRTLWGAMGATIVSASLAVFAWQAAIRANRLKDESVEAEKIATAQKLIAQSEQLQSNNPELRHIATLLALEAYNRLRSINQPTTKAKSNIQRSALPLPNFTLWQDDVSTFALSSNGKYIAIGRSNGSVEILETANQKTILTTQHNYSITKIIFSKNSQYLATLNSENQVKIISTSKPKIIASISQEKKYTDISFSENSNYLAIESSHGEIDVVNTNSGQILNTIHHDSSSSSIAFSENSNYFVSASSDGTAKVLDLKENTIHLAAEHDDFNWNFNLTSNSDYLITWSNKENGHINVFSNLDKETVIQEDYEGTIVDSKVSPDNRHLAVATDRGQIQIFDLASARLIADLVREGKVSSLEFSDNTFLLAVTFVGQDEIEIIDPKSQEIIRELDHPYASHLLFLERGKKVVTQSGYEFRIFDLASGKQISVIEHKALIEGFEVSENEQYFASYDSDDMIKIVNLHTGEIIRSFKQTGVENLKFSGNSEHLIAKSSYVLNVIETNTGRVVSTMHHAASIKSFSLSQNDYYLATLDYSSEMRVASLIASEASQFQFKYSNNSIGEGSFNSDKSLLFLFSGDHNLDVVDTNSGNIVSKIHRGNLSGRNSKFWVSSQSHCIVLKDGNNIVKIFDLINNAEIKVNTYENNIDDVVLSENEKNLAVSTRDGSLNIVDLASGDLIESINIEMNTWFYQFTPDGNYILVWQKTGEGKVHIFKTQTGELVNDITVQEDFDDRSRSWNIYIDDNSKYFTLSHSRSPKVSVVSLSTGNLITEITHEAPVKTIVLSEGGKYLLTYTNNSIKTFRLDQGVELESIEASDSVKYAEFSQDGETLAVYDDSGEIIIYSPETNQEIARLTHASSINYLKFSHNGRYIATGSSDNTAKLIDAETGGVIAILEANASVQEIEFSKSDQYLAVRSEDRIVRIVDTQTGEVENAIEHSDNISQMRFSSDSRYLALIGKNDIALVVQSDTGEIISRTLHDNTIEEFNFSGDGRYFASGDADGIVKLIKNSTGEEIAVVSHKASITHLDFSESSNILVTSSEDKNLYLTRIEGDFNPQDVCKRLSQNLSAEDWRKYTDAPLNLYQLTCGNSPAHSSVLNEAGNLARLGKREEAEALISYLKDISPDIDLYPRTKEVDDNVNSVINMWQANALVDQGIRAIKSNNLLEAKGKFESAQTISQDIDLDRDTVLIESIPEEAVNSIAARFKVQRNKYIISQDSQPNSILDALDDYQDAIELDPEIQIYGSQWNQICFFGAIQEISSEVLPACEASVDMAPDHGGYRGSRGLARALTGNINGAIEDFQAYIDWSGSPPRRKRQRQEWIEVLQAGENPFTEELLEELREEG